MSLRRSLKPLAAVVAIGAPGYIYYRFRTKQESFDIPVRVKGPDGKSEMTTRTFPLLPLATLEARLNQNATAHAQTRPGGLVWKYATASLASNDPLEDANANAIVQRDSSDPAAPGDFLFFAVMDGHGGYETSQLLSKVLIKAVAAKISTLNTEPTSPKSTWWGGLRSALFASSSSSANSKQTAGPGDSDPQRVSSAIQDAFVELDHELISAPLRILASNLDEESRKKGTTPDLSQHPLALKSMHPAISGSCALMSVFDTAHRNLYVAVTGDSRAVAGIWEPSEDGKGSWRVEALTEDQTGRNPSELARMRSEHPKEEENDVIREGRVLGGLEPTRAFGDARYKWPRTIQQALNQAFLVGNGSSMRNPPTLFKTPPYVTAQPVVTHRHLPLTEASSKPNYFLVMATDGLWDELSNDDVISLVGGYLSGVKGTVPKSDLPSLVPIASGASGVEGKRNKKSNKTDGSWAFVDDNVSAHLIRNAFGGGDEGTLRRRLSIPAPFSRRYRDDVTVTVVWWENGNEHQAQISKDQLKAKL
ncbi:phophatase 2C family protein [Coprinopsis marcescibilis]|uniref:Phophatase 2C family protein n=1 Tax=Coprinopsis marcescibilis TaxID=230819 RepID=A0A5C3KWN1_COPMA|nr:phophatase 2C family protein [Coprinopsis marcescibilis]